MPDNLAVLSSDSVEKLRNYLPQHYNALVDFDDDIKHDLGLIFVPTHYEFDGNGATLEHPVSRDQVGFRDAENCVRILKFLPNLTAADATDERLWTTLATFQFRDYVLARWPVTEQKAEERDQYVRNHWFAAGVRGRMRNNAISRLWWMGHIATKIPGRSMEEVFEVLFYNSDYRSSLLERNTSANAINVTAGILEVTKRAYETGVQFNRERFRDFMKDVDFLGGRINLASLSVEQVIEVTTPLYKKAYDMA